MEVLKVDYQDPNAAEFFCRSLRETGFAVIKNHPIDQVLIEKVYADWRTFFAGDEKFDYQFDEKDQAGYFPMSIAEVAKGSEVRDHKEFFHVYLNNKYPKSMGGDTLTLFAAMSQMAATLLEWVEQQSPSEIKAKYSMPLSAMIKDSPKTLLRILHYPPFAGTEPAGAVRAAAHEDINMLTLLPAATQSGLQVKDLSGNWHDVPCDYGTIAVNCGDMLQMASDHYFPSTTHRVINPEDNDANVSRLSLPLFLHALPEVMLSENYTAEAYLNERLRELGHLTS